MAGATGAKLLHGCCHGSVMRIYGGELAASVGFVVEGWQRLRGSWWLWPCKAEVAILMKNPERPQREFWKILEF